MKFISLSSPSHLVKWKKTGGLDGLYISGQLVLLSEVPLVDFFLLKQEVRPYVSEPVYQGTSRDDANSIFAKMTQTSQDDSRLVTSKGLPDFKFCIDRNMGQPIYICNHENDADGCLLESTIMGFYGFKAQSEGEILAEYKTEDESPATTNSWFTTLSVLLPGQSIVMESNTHGVLRTMHTWDGKLLKTECSPRLRGEAVDPQGPWAKLEKLQLK
jgi:hypothetical protein